MNDQIVCPNCKKVIPLTEALSHQIQEKYQKFYKHRLEEEKEKIELSLRETLARKIKQEMDLQLKDKSNELEELRRQNKTLQEQFLELNKLIRQLRNENQQGRIELEKKLAVEQERIRAEEKKRSDEEYRLKIMEKDKKLSDAMKMVDEYKRKLEQGSQQLQGEVLELELENTLRKEFPYDEIREVPKGISGADLLQTIRNNSGRNCGTIIWESKRTKVWSEGWITKLRDDQRRVKADIAVIISQALPEKMNNFIQRNGVWITNFENITGLALLLRNSLIELSAVKLSMVGKQEKKEILWNYLTSLEFKQRIEAVYDAYSQLQNDLKKEKDWFRHKWSKQEKNIEKVSENILGIHGDLQGIIGKFLPEIKGLDLLPSGDNEEKTETLF